MKKKILVKIVGFFFIFIFSFLLQWKLTFGGIDCKIDVEKIKVKSCFPPLEENSNEMKGIYPFEDFLIRI